MASVRTTCTVCLVVLVFVYQCLWVVYYFSHHNDFVKVKLINMADMWKKYNFRFTTLSSLHDDNGVLGDHPAWIDTKVVDFFLIGAQKSGTTTVSRYMERHPKVPSRQRKELLFFNGPWGVHKAKCAPSYTSLERSVRSFVPSVRPSVGSCHGSTCLQQIHLVIPSFSHHPL